MKIVDLVKTFRNFYAFILRRSLELLSSFLSALAEPPVSKESHEPVFLSQTLSAWRRCPFRVACHSHSTSKNCAKYRSTINHDESDRFDGRFSLHKVCPGRDRLGRDDRVMECIQRHWVHTEPPRQVESRIDRCQGHQILFNALC